METSGMSYHMFLIALKLMLLRTYFNDFILHLVFLELSMNFFLSNLIITKKSLKSRYGYTALLCMQ